jgi:hypothetical protein
MQVKYGEHRDDVNVNGEEDAVWEPANERPPSAFIDFGELKWILQQSREHGVDVSSSRRRFDTSASARVSDSDWPQTRRRAAVSPSDTQASEELLADFRPGA